MLQSTSAVDVANGVANDILPVWMSCSETAAEISVPSFATLRFVQHCSELRWRYIPSVLNNRNHCFMPQLNDITLTYVVFYIPITVESILCTT